MYSSREYFEEHLGTGSEPQQPDWILPGEVLRLVQSIDAPHGFEKRVIATRTPDDDDPDCVHTEYCIYVGEVLWH